MKLRNFDLNLLVIVEIVLTELSVTRAAKRLNLSQPAVSQAMVRARDIFGDELLVRNGSQATLTPLGRRLLPQLTEFCSKADGVLSATGFDPPHAQIDFTISANDVSELLILPPLISAVARLAPGCRLIVRAPEHHLLDASIDLAIFGAPVPPGPFVVQQLYEEHFVIIARRDHPEMGEGLTAERYVELPQALVSPTGQGLVGPVDTKLDELGLSRRIALSVSRFTTLPEIIASTDLIAAVPSRFAEWSEVRRRCGIWPLPFESPRFAMRMAWHKVHDNDPAHQWLRNLL